MFAGEAIFRVVLWSCMSFLLRWPRCGYTVASISAVSRFCLVRFALTCCCYQLIIHSAGTGLLYAFDSTLGFPGEGPGEGSGLFSEVSKHCAFVSDHMELGDGSDGESVIDCTGSDDAYAEPAVASLLSSHEQVPVKASRRKVVKLSSLRTSRRCSNTDASADVDDSVSFLQLGVCSR
jgi:hypothetical protein